MTKHSLYTSFLSVLCKHCQSKLPDGTKPDELCRNYIQWCHSYFASHGREFNETSHVGSSCSNYIGQEIIRCFHKDDDVQTTKLDYDAIDRFIQEKLKGKDSIVTAAWLVSLCFVITEDDSASISTRYILPALCNADLNKLSVDLRLDYNIASCCMDEIAASSTTFYSVDSPADGSPRCMKESVPWYETVGKSHVITAIDYIYDKNLPLSDIFVTQAEGYGDALYELLHSSKIDHIDNTNEDAQLKAYGLTGLLDQPHLGGSLILAQIAAISLFAEGKFDKGTEMLLDVYNIDEHTRITPCWPTITIALFTAFFECKEYDQKMRLYTTIKYERACLMNKFGINTYLRLFPENLMADVDEEMYHFILNTLKLHLDQVLNTKQDGSLSEKAKMKRIEQIHELMVSMSSIFFTAKRVAYAKELEQSAATFLNQHPLKRGLYDSLADAVKRRIKNGLLESGVLFELNTILHEEDCENGAQGDNDRDYSAVILPMTKALELLGNLIFQGAIEDADLTQMSNAEKEKLKFFIKNGDWSDSLTLGNVAYMFKLEEFEGNPNYLPDLFKVIDKTKLPTLQGIDLGYQNLPLSKRGPMIDAKFTDNTDPAGVITNYNLKVLSVILQYITDNFRNKCAHKDKIGIAEYEQCKDLLVTGKHLIWILLYLLKDDIQLGAESSETNDN